MSPTPSQFNGPAAEESTERASERLLRRALHQIEQEALANAAVGDAQPADRPSGADCVEDGAAAEQEMGALASNARVGGAALDDEPREMARDQLDLSEGQHAALDQGPARARPSALPPG